jgi:tripartite-type tricarboxylate transporter receptor subunit TctC
MKKTNLLRCLAAVAGTLFASCLHAQAFPSKPVRMLVPWAAGGSVDVLGRALASELGKAWGQPVVVENPAGAASIIGAGRVATSAPDGHTLLFTLDGTVVANRVVYRKLPYDPDKDLAPVTMIGRSALFIVAASTFGPKTMRELIEAARRAPGTIAYSSGGNGAPGHLLFELIASREAVQFIHVPYKGVAPAMAAAIAGEVQLSATSPGQGGSTIRAGKLAALAITGQHRAKGFPDVPTVAEAGYPYAGLTFWWGLFAPGGTSAQIVERIWKDAAAVVARPEFSERFLAGVGIDPVASSPAEFAKAIRADVERFTEMARAAKLAPQD